MKKNTMPWRYTRGCPRTCQTCPGYSTIINWLRWLERGEDITQWASRSGPSVDNQIDSRTVIVLEETPFHSVRSIGSAIKCPRSTVWRHLHNTGSIVHNLHLVPHKLSLAQKPESRTTSIELKNGAISEISKLALFPYRWWIIILFHNRLWSCLNLWRCWDAY
jgi:hypothetical protein